MPGVLDLAYDILHENVRIATPDYIGVREPQYTSGVGLIKHSYQKLNYVGKMYRKSKSILNQYQHKLQRRYNSNLRNKNS